MSGARVVVLVVCSTANELSGAGLVSPICWGHHRGLITTHSGSGFPLASHVMGKLSSKGKAMRELGDCSVMVGSCSTGQHTRDKALRYNLAIRLHVAHVSYKTCFTLNKMVWDHLSLLTSLTNVCHHSKCVKVNKSRWVINGE